MATRPHLSDAPTILPADCAAIVLHPDGTVDIYIPSDEHVKNAPNSMRVNIAYGAMLYGDSGDGDTTTLRNVANDLIKARLAVIRAKRGK